MRYGGEASKKSRRNEADMVGRYTVGAIWYRQDGGGLWKHGRGAVNNEVV